MSEKTLTTIAVIAGVIVLAMFLMKQQRTVKVPTTTKGTTTGSSVWADIGAGLGGLAKGIFGGSSSSSGSSDSGGVYTWGGYQDSDLRLGGDEG